MKYNRIFLIVCDSLGIGNACDSALYDDYGANTLKHICEKCNGLDVVNLEGLGLGNLGDFKGIHQLSLQLGYTLSLSEISNGKDTMTGHWEMMGLKTEKPFITFTDTGFPDEFIRLFEEKTGRKCVGNKAASGTEIIQEYGEHQIKTGDWIVYTSADSVFQIAANEEVIPLEELYEACQIARELAMDERWKVGRIIARPFIGKKAGEFERTANRHDLALAPFDKTVLDTLKENNFDVIVCLAEEDILFQCNCGSLIGHFGYRAKKTVEKMMQFGYVDMFGSDCHDLETRNLEILDVYYYLESLYGIDYCKKVFYSNAKELLLEK